jgi:hypothetical protein
MGATWQPAGALTGALSPCWCVQQHRLQQIAVHVCRLLDSPPQCTTLPGAVQAMCLLTQEYAAALTLPACLPVSVHLPVSFPAAADAAWLPAAVRPACLKAPSPASPAVPAGLGRTRWRRAAACGRRVREAPRALRARRACHLCVLRQQGGADCLCRRLLGQLQLVRQGEAACVVMHLRGEAWEAAVEPGMPG